MLSRHMNRILYSWLATPSFPHPHDPVAVPAGLLQVEVPLHQHRTRHAPSDSQMAGPDDVPRGRYNGRADVG